MNFYLKIVTVTERVDVRTALHLNCGGDDIINIKLMLS